MTHTSKEQPELLPCPFCGGHSTLDSNGQDFRVFCWDCGAKSKEVDCWQKAEAAWNRRDPQPQAQHVPLSEPITHVAYRPTWDGETWAMTQIVPMNSIKVDQLKTHWETHRDFSDDPFTAGLSYAERAHGITQEKQG